MAGRNRLFRFSIIIIFFSIISFSNTSAIQAETDSRIKNLPISDFVVEGNKKTNSHIIIKRLLDYKGLAVSDFDESEARNRLMKLDIFKEIKFDYLASKTNVTLKVLVVEKFTLIPLPVASSSRGINSAGLFILERNLFGLGKTFYGGGIGSTNGWEAMAGYYDTSVFASNYRFNLTYKGGEQLFDNGVRSKEIRQTYKALSHEIKNHTGYTFTENLAAGSYMRYQTFKKRSGEHTFNDEPITDATVISPGLYFTYTDFIMVDFYRKGLLLYSNAGIDQSNSQSVETFFRSETRLRATTAGFFDHAFGISFFSMYSEVPQISEHRIGGIQGSKTLPLEMVSTDSYAALTLFYEIPVIHFDWVTFTMLQFFEGGFYKNERTPQPVKYYGPGFGIRMYLKDIAIPALGFDVSYAIPEKELLSSIAFGFAM